MKTITPKPFTVNLLLCFLKVEKLEKKDPSVRERVIIPRAYFSFCWREGILLWRRKSIFNNFFSTRNISYIITLVISLQDYSLITFLCNSFLNLTHVSQSYHSPICWQAVSECGALVNFLTCTPRISSPPGFLSKAFSTIYSHYRKRENKFQCSIQSIIKNIPQHVYIDYGWKFRGMTKNRSVVNGKHLRREQINNIFFDKVSLEPNA